MEEKITLCGDDCLTCPRYHAKTDEELRKVAELWYRVGMRDHVVSNDEIRCDGCSDKKECSYHLYDCTRENNVSKCNQCSKFPCGKINRMLELVEEHKVKWRDLCSDEEYEAFDKSFFQKEENFKKKDT